MAMSLGGNAFVSGSRVLPYFKSSVMSKNGVGNMLFMSRFGNALLVAVFVKKAFLFSSFVVVIFSLHCDCLTDVVHVQWKEQLLDSKVSLLLVDCLIFSQSSFLLCFSHLFCASFLMNAFRVFAGLCFLRIRECVFKC